MRRSSSRARTADLDWETFTKKYGAPGKTSLVVPAPLPAEVLFSALKSYCGDGSTRIVIYPSSLAEIALGLARDAPGASSVSRSVNQLRAELRAGQIDVVVPFIREDRYCLLWVNKQVTATLPPPPFRIPPPPRW
jgi:hypothetical protein